ncbi:hypothetical protein PV682_35005 [Streptomyces niveiscabiei]|uniref:hypothetical protein n=1 Tax=Streptomyces niveiscabiei TaxID=164115 RepID=UPI0029BF477B|nr:hypothetical protein [Streptomyces niveiscabiei]MDX3386617.1 hypothetical protein [Streptomyces niveiscabiei]
MTSRHPAADEGRGVTVRRSSERATVADAERLRHYLASAFPSRAEAVADDR